MGGKLCASLPITHLRSIPHLSTIPPNHPYFSPSVIHPTYLQFFQPPEIRQKLHLPIYHFKSLLVFWFIVSTQRLFLVIPSILHLVLCNFWKGFLIEIFRSRSSLLQFLQDTLLTNGFLGVPGVHRRSPFFPPPLAHQRVAYTRQRVHRSCGRVKTTSAPTTSQRLGYRWFRVKPTFPDAERSPLGGAWTSRAVRAGSHFFSINRTSAAYVIVSIFFCLFLGLFVLSPYSSLLLLCLEPLGSVPTPNHLNWWPRFFTSVSRIFRPASSEALPPRTFIPSLGISCLGFVFVFFGFVVGEPTPSLFVGFSTSSSFWIRSGNDPPL
jgi:hypothetical protein